MLTRSQKEKVVKDLRDKIDRSQAVFLTNLIGLKSNDSNLIRKGIREAKGTMVITKNTLFKLAAKGTACEDLLKDLKGTNTVAFAFNEAPAVAKVIYDAGKEHDTVSLNTGIFEGKVLNKAELESLAKLPSREEMLSTLLATFNAPVSAFARVIDAIKGQKEEGGVEVAVSPEGTTEEQSSKEVE